MEISTECAMLSPVVEHYCELTDHLWPTRGANRLPSARYFCLLVLFLQALSCVTILNVSDKYLAFDTNR